ncbi:hypothetical protein [Bradyrhizobium erythrophlei]|uniref:Uncharacterized protein n=1 Tax=Bradyrhizobium erythrophlei TaxID=1437360 RepID=A0A1M5NN00_9BRAD|nr:hypothetical protein [Bradyrhizobium erythrophlei]SHG90868.1 hypothetical protein SAMN05443248_3056 [Bradyrhizobium erythrophlei]
MHHVHISTFALFLIVLFVLGFMSILFAFIVSMRRAKVDAARFRAARFSDDYASRTTYRQSERGPAVSSGGYTAAPGVYASPMVAPVMMQGASGSDLLTGVLLGEALAGGHRDTVIVENGGGYGGGYDAPAYDPGPSFDSGISFDSGPVCDTGGGIDLSW